MNIKKTIVNSVIHLPHWFNRVLLYFNNNANIIYGRRYYNYSRFLNSSFNFNNEKRLLDIVNKSIKNVPFYNSNKELKNIDDFRKLDFINKDIVANNYKDFQNINIKDSKYDLVTTGGTTGAPLRMLLPKSRYIKENAILHWIWKRVGFSYHTRAVLRNHSLKRDQIYKINPITKELLFDGFRLSDDYYYKVYAVIKKYRIKFIHAYPSNAYSFSKFMFNKKLDYTFIKGFISSSENVLDYQRQFIEHELGIEFLTFYGHSEKLVLAWYCKYCKCSHVEPSYGYFELIDEDGDIIFEAGRVGEIVGTTLDNEGFPLIRYRTDDYAELVGFRCEYENRDVVSIKNIRGRWTGNFIYSGDGNKTTATALNLHDDLYLYIDGIQYIQEIKGELKVLVIKGSGFNNDIKKRLKKHFENRLQNTKIDIEFVDSLIKQTNGKFLDLISKI